MPGHLPSLDREALLRLRAMVKRLREAGTDGVPMAELVELSRCADPELGLTVDLDAARELGEPMVVVRLPSDGGPPDWFARLSPREREVAGLVAEGLANKQIARRLDITLGTVKDHVHRILEKADLPGRAAVAAALGGRFGHAGEDPN